MHHILFLLSVFCLLSACTSSTSPQEPVHVSVVQEQGQYRLRVDGLPFTVKGVGMDTPSPGSIEKLVQTGGNAIRTWSTRHADSIFPLAEKHDIMVALGLPLGQELHGFDYQDAAAVAKQLEEIKQTVNRYKDHPNLLCWVAGNELNLLFDELGQLKQVSPETYLALGEIVDYIHEVDPHHPVTTTFAGYNPDHIALARKHCPQLDILSFQVYGALYSIHDDLAKMGFTDPYFITEYGPMGHWERPTTAWGREIEEASHPKAVGFRTRMEHGFAPDTLSQNLGGFAFLWGQKQERTPTWYGMFLASGKATEVVDELQHFWTGAYPAHRAPQVNGIRLEGALATDNVYLQPGQEVTANLDLPTGTADSVSYRWEVLAEVGERSQGGAFEQEPDKIPVNILQKNPRQILFTAPSRTGEYRLFAYIYDGKGKAGYANFPFYVGTRD